MIIVITGVIKTKQGLIQKFLMGVARYTYCKLVVYGRSIHNSVKDVNNFVLQGVDLGLAEEGV